MALNATPKAAAAKRTINEANITPPQIRHNEQTMTDMFANVTDALQQKSSTYNDPELKSIADNIKIIANIFESFNANMLNCFTKLEDKIDAKIGRQLGATSNEDYMKIAKFEAEEKERLRSIVIAGVPESNHPLPSHRNREDSGRVCYLLDELGVEATPVSVYRMGMKGRIPRLVKVLLPASFFQKEALRNANRLRQHPNPQIKNNVFVRASLTSQQRKEAQLMQKKVKHLNTKAGKFMYCIYAGNIAIKTRAGPTGARPKPEQVSNEKLDELLQDFDANATPLGARGNNGGGRDRDTVTGGENNDGFNGDDDMDEEQQNNSFL